MSQSGRDIPLPGAAAWGRGFALRAGSPFAQGLVFCAVFLLLLLLIPLVILAAAAGLTLFAASRIRALFTRAHQPNGMLDGRRNVRVRLPDDPPQA